MPVYMIGTIDVEDAATYDLYRSFNPALVEAAGGKYIIKGKPVSPLEGDDFRSRFVMIEFANEAALKRFYDSPAYEALRPLRHKSSKSTIAFVNTDSDTSERTAYQVTEFGPVIPLKPLTASAPPLAPTDIRIQPTLISVNPIDWKIRAGFLAALPVQFPFTSGCEGVGIVEAVGDAVTDFSPGQRVMAHTSLARGGWYASSVDIGADQCALVPADMSDEKAATIGVPLLTAAQAIACHKGALNNALVIGGSGSVGSIAIKLLQRKAEQVDALCSDSNAEFVTSLGARVLPPEEAAQGAYDFVLDASGGPVIEAGYRGLGKGGTLVSIVQPVDEARAAAQSGQAIRYSVKPSGEQLAQLLANHDALPDPRIATILPLDEANTALYLCQHGRMRGKILLRP